MEERDEVRERSDVDPTVEAALRGANAEATDVMALVQASLREAYLENTGALRDYADKVKFLNARKRAVREYLSALREYRASVLTEARERGIDVCSSTADSGELAAVFERHAKDYEPGNPEIAWCIPTRVPPAGVRSLEHLDVEIVRWEGQLASVGDDGQLANVDLQNWLQKMQQTLQMMSNLSKLNHDTAMAVIRKIGG